MTVLEALTSMHTHQPPRTLGAFSHKGQTVFVLYAPFAETAVVVFPDNGKRQQMYKIDGGYFQSESNSIGPGTRYFFQTDKMDEPRPDPASLWQPMGVHQMSVVVDQDLFSRKQPYWKGRSIHDMVIYELHIGTFSEAGTFHGAIEHLADLVKLGVNTIQLLPINQFPGHRNWGYDGVYWRAVQDSYGGPEGLIAFIDAAHDLNLAVLIDAVYNHLGPEGNYLPEFAPYFNHDRNTPWGASINLDAYGSDGVRDLILASAKTWLVDYGADGLRLDAVHELNDNSATHIIEELSAQCKVWSREVRRPLTLIGESARNDPRYITSLAENGLGLTGQWADDFHHALRSYFTGEVLGHFSDYGTKESLLKALQTAFVFTGEYSEHKGRRFGRSVAAMKSHQFVVFGQNHDQVGNRLHGDRLHNHLSEKEYILQAAMVIWSPFTPMLFMGEEYVEQSPFPYFVDHGDERVLKDTVNGRRNSFAPFKQKVEEMPDPVDLQTFESAKLSHARNGETYKFYREALAVRRQFWPLRIRDLNAHDVEELRQDVIALRMPLTTGKKLIVIFNMSQQTWALNDGPASWSVASADLRCATSTFRGELPSQQAAVWLS